MAHFDEMTCMLYLDGQLDALRAGELELHMRSCTPCRTLLSALKTEASFLRNAILEEDESVPAHLLAPPQPDHIPWGWLAAMSMACAGLYYVAGIFSGFAGQFSQAGFSSVHVLGQAFSSAVFWKGWGDVMMTLIIVSVAVLSLPAGWFAWKNFRRIKPVAVVLAGLTAVLLAPAPAAAQKIVRGQAAFAVAEGETLQEDLIVASTTVRIEGTVEGDVIAFSESIVVTGHIKGDLLAFTRRLRVSGQVEGSIRGFANQINVEGKVTRNVTAFCESFDLDEKSELSGSLILFSASSDLDGRIGRDVLAFAEKLRINGNVQGDITTRSNLRLGSRSEVGGRIKVNARRPPEVLNEALRSRVQFTMDEREGPDYSKPGYYWRQMLKFGAAFFFGLVFLLLLPGFYDDVQRQNKRYGPALGVGLITLFATPILAIVACITLVGMAIGLGGLLLWLVLMYSAQVAVGAWIGARLLGESFETPARIGRLALGLLVVRIATSLPEVHSYIWFVIVVWGMGSITLALFRTFRASMDAATPLPPAAATAPAPPAVAT
jgi:cytoskeletal protein CcmA (bactofilin family)